MTHDTKRDRQPSDAGTSSKMSWTRMRNLTPWWYDSRQTGFGIPGEMEISDWDKAELWKHPKGENGEIFLDPELPLPPTIIGKERRYLSWLVAVKKLLDLHPNHVHIYTLFRHAQSLDLSSPRGLHDFSSEFVGETPLTASKAPNVAPSTTSQALLTKTRDWNHCKFICAVLNYQVVC